MADRRSVARPQNMATNRQLHNQTDRLTHYGAYVCIGVIFWYPIGI